MVVWLRWISSPVDLDAYLLFQTVDSIWGCEDVVLSFWGLLHTQVARGGFGLCALRNKISTKLLSVYSEVMWHQPTNVLVSSFPSSNCISAIAFRERYRWQRIAAPFPELIICMPSSNYSYLHFVEMNPWILIKGTKSATFKKIFLLLRPFHSFLPVGSSGQGTFAVVLSHTSIMTQTTSVTSTWKKLLISLWLGCLET